MARIPFIGYFRRLLQPRLLALIVSVVLLAWSGWQWWSVWRDPKVEPADVAGREVRINHDKLENVKGQLEAYSHPTALTTTPKNLFIPENDNAASGG